MCIAYDNIYDRASQLFTQRMYDIFLANTGSSLLNKLPKNIIKIRAFANKGDIQY